MKIQAENDLEKRAEIAKKTKNVRLAQRLKRKK